MSTPDPSNPDEEHVESLAKKLEESKTMFSPAERLEDFDPDITSCGLTPEMLQEAAKLYNMTFASKNPVDRLAGEVFYKDVDFEKLSGGTTEGVSAE